MRVALVSTSTYPSDQGIRHVSSMLKAHKHEVKVFFLPEAENYSKKYNPKVLDQLLGMCAHFDVIGISSYASTSVRAVQVINHVGSLGKPIIWGGVHATISPEKCIEHVDLVCVGEGEHTMLELLDRLERKQDITGIANLWVRKNGKVYKNEIRNLVHDLDSLPPPDYDLEDHYILERDRIVPFQERHLNGMIFFQTERGCPNSCTYCFIGQSAVVSDKGVKKIKDVKVGDEVLTDKGKFKKVNFVYKRPYKGMLVKIKVAKLGRPLMCTPNHKILVFRGHPVFIEASEIKVGDKLCLVLPQVGSVPKRIDSYEELKGYSALSNFPRKYGVEKMQKCIALSQQGISTRKIASETGISKSYVHYIVDGFNKNKMFVNKDRKEVEVKLKETDGLIYFSLGKNKVKRFISIDQNFCRLTGYYLAEGSVNKLRNRPNSRVTVFTFGKHEKGYITDCILLVKKTLGINPSITEQGSVVHIVIYNNVISALFEKLFGSGARSKKIPSNFFSLTNDKILEVLTGYIRGDGSKDLDCSTTSHSLAYQLFLLSHKAGFTPGLYWYIKNDSYIDGRLIRGKDYYLLTFRTSKNRDILKKTVFNMESNVRYRKNPYTKEGNHILLPVTAVGFANFEGSVYNLEVDDDHTYTINGLAVANCSNNILKKLHTGKGKLLRFNSMGYVINEMARLKKKFPTLGVFDIRDETLFARPLSDFQEFSSRYKKEVGLRFKCLADPPTMNEQKLSLLVDAGLTDIIIGIQGSERVNFEIYKRFITDEQTLRAAQVINKFKGKVAVMYDVITSNPYETHSDIINLISLLVRLPKPYYLSVNNLVFFFGTPLYDKAVADRVIKSRRDSAFDLNYWDRWKHIRLKRKNAYLNLILNLMRGPCTGKRYGLLPYFLLRVLVKPKVVRFNLKHVFPTYFVGFFVQVFDFVRENVAKPVYRSTPTSFKVWYDRVRYRV